MSGYEAKPWDGPLPRPINPGPSSVAADHPDDPARPMTRTELAMLWDLLNRWTASHPAGAGLGSARRGAARLCIEIDVELAQRFGS